MYRTLVIGYGNLDRGDDGVAHHVVNELRQRLGQPPLNEGDTGLEKLGAQVDSILLMQLVPELVDTLFDYDRVIFIDAHVREDMPDLYCTPVLPEYTTSAFTHHMTPAMILALVKLVHHRNPEGYIVSIRGHNFDFHRHLSLATQAMVPVAVETVLQIIAGEGSETAE